MSKTLRRNKSKRRAPATPTSRRPVTRREYAELVMRLGSVEIQAQRNRATIDLQAQRIAQLQAEIDALRASTVPQALAKEIAALPGPATVPTVES